MKFFLFYYETELENKHGIGAFEAKSSKHIDKMKMIREIEGKTKLKVTRFETKEISRTQFKDIYSNKRSLNIKPPLGLETQ